MGTRVRRDPGGLLASYRTPMGAPRDRELLPREQILSQARMATSDGYERDAHEEGHPIRSSVMIADHGQRQVDGVVAPYKCRIRPAPAGPRSPSAPGTRPPARRASGSPTAGP